MPLAGPLVGTVAQVKQLGPVLDCTCGRVDAFSAYAYHAAPVHFVQPVPGSAGTGHSGMLGWMADGFPLFGPQGDTGVAPNDLDACGGHASDSGANGSYHYHVVGLGGQCGTTGASLLRLPSCLAGCVADSTHHARLLQQETFAQCASTGVLADAASEAFKRAWRPNPVAVQAANLNCSAAVPSSPEASTLGVAELVMLLVVALTVMAVTLFIVFRDDLEACCNPAAAYAHRGTQPRAFLCTGSRLLIPAGSGLDICLTRTGLGCLAPRLEDATGPASPDVDDVLGALDSPIHTQTSKHSLAPPPSRSTSFARRMHMTLPSPDLESQGCSSAESPERAPQKAASHGTSAGQPNAQHPSASSTPRAKHPARRVAPSPSGS